MNIISFKNVHFTYPGDDQESLCGIDLDIAAGSFVAVLGHNGSGKSTLAKHMNAILVPDEGQVLIDGIDTADEDRVIDVRRTVGMVFQNPDNQIVANVVEDDVAFAPENLGVPPEEIRRRVDEALSRWTCTISACMRRTSCPAGRSSASPLRASLQCSRA